MSSKRILITGSTDGIGLAAANELASLGHHVLIHGRSATKVDAVVGSLSHEIENAKVEGYVADLSQMSAVESLACDVTATHPRLDALINNAGVFMVPEPVNAYGLDMRFVVNTVAPYLLTQRLLPTLDKAGRIINLSSAAQASVSLDALSGHQRLADGEAYAQSKLALTMWSRDLASRLGDEGPLVIAVNPGSFLGSKMVQEAYGRAGKDLQIGADILTRLATSSEFASASGQYFDNDAGRLASPHPDGLDTEKIAAVVHAIETMLVEPAKW